MYGLLPVFLYIFDSCMISGLPYRFFSWLGSHIQKFFFCNNLRPKGLCFYQLALCPYAADQIICIPADTVSWDAAQAPYPVMDFIPCEMFQLPCHCNGLPHKWVFFFHMNAFFLMLHFLQILSLQAPSLPFHIILWTYSAVRQTRTCFLRYLF